MSPTWSLKPVEWWDTLTPPGPLSSLCCLDCEFAKKYRHKDISLYHFIVNIMMFLSSLYVTEVTHSSLCAQLCKLVFTLLYAEARVFNSISIWETSWHTCRVNSQSLKLIFWINSIAFNDSVCFLFACIYTILQKIKGTFQILHIRVIQPVMVSNA